LEIQFFLFIFTYFLFLFFFVALRTFETEMKDENPSIPKLAFSSVCSGVVAACLSAPFISIVDKAITSNASGREPMWVCMKNGLLKLVKEPRAFFKQPSFIWIAFVYSGTYVAANVTQLICELNNRPWQYPKFVAASTANITLSMLKDRAFARMFAKEGAPTRPFPVLSLGLFAARDSMTVFASFNLPPIITPIVESLGVPHVAARSAVQLVTPVAMQLFNVPLHLYALDLYNRPDVSIGQRLSFVRREYTKTVLARWARILPAFGIGGVINIELQELSRHLLGLPPLAH
jgi:hypothetical protein